MRTDRLFLLEEGTRGGRTGSTLTEAQKNAYALCEKVDFPQNITERYWTPRVFSDLGRFKLAIFVGEDES